MKPYLIIKLKLLLFQLIGILEIMCIGSLIYNRGYEYYYIVLIIICSLLNWIIINPE